MPSPTDAHSVTSLDQFFEAHGDEIAAFENALIAACNSTRKDRRAMREAVRAVSAKFDQKFVSTCAELRAVAPYAVLAEALRPEPPQVKPEPEPSQDDDYTVSQIYDEEHIRRVMKEIDSEWAMVTLGTQLRIMREPAKPGAMPNFHGLDAFRGLYMNKKINVPTGDGNFKAVPVSKLWLECPHRRTFIDGVVFEPEGGSRNAYNLWRGYPTQPVPGSWVKLKAHVRDNICQGDVERYTWFMTWLAQLVQQPGRKLGSAVVIKGLKGTGKSKLFEWVKRGMGNHAIKVSQKKHIVGDFNGHHKGVTLMICEEAFWAGDHAAGNALKDLITSEDMMFEQKGIDAIPLSNYMRLAFISNHEWVVPVGEEDERRYFVLECADTHRGDKKYFAAIDREMESGGLEAMWFELMNWDVWEHYPEEGWDILRTPPVTDAQLQQREAGLEVWDRFFVRLLEDGRLKARENPDAAEIELEEDEVTKLPVADLREQFDAAMKDAGTADARRKINNGPALLTLAQKWLDVGDNAPSVRVKGEKVRAYLIAPLADLRARARARGVRLDVGIEIEEPERHPTRGNVDRFAAAAREAQGRS